MSADRYTQKTTQKTKRMGLDSRTRKIFQQLEKVDNRITMPSKLQFKQRKFPNNRCKYKRIGSGALAKTKRRKFKTDQICEQIFIGHQEEVCNKRSGDFCSSFGSATFLFLYLWKANRITKRSPSIETTNQEQRSNETNSAKINMMVGPASTLGYKYKAHCRKTSKLNILLE